MDNKLTLLAVGLIIIFIVLWILFNKGRQYTIKVDRIVMEDNSKRKLRDKKCIPNEYIKIGYVENKDIDDPEKIKLDLYARKKIDRNRWQYFVIYDKYLLPIIYKNKDCNHLIGCEFIKTGNEIIVPEYANKVFIANVTVNYSC